MKLAFRGKLITCFLVLLIAVVNGFGQEFSLDDHPTGPLRGPFVAPFGSAEDEFGIMGASLGPSPSLQMFWLFDSDVLMPGPALSIRFTPAPLWPPVFPPASPSPYYVDAYSVDHTPVLPPPLIPIPHTYITLRFSVDRQSIGAPGSAVRVQAMLNQQPADIYDSNPSFAIPWNALIWDDGFFGLWTGNGVNPAAVLCPGIQMGTHDNIDAYNEFPGPTMAGWFIFFCLHPADAITRGFSPADIMVSQPGPLALAGAPFAFAPQMGLDNVGGPNSDSIDALVIWDVVNPGVCDPFVDIALFSLAPGSPTLAAGPWDGSTIFWTNFSGPPLPLVYCFGNQLDLAPGDNVDALDAY